MHFGIIVKLYIYDWKLKCKQNDSTNLHCFKLFMLSLIINLTLTTPLFIKVPAPMIESEVSSQSTL